MLIRGHFQSEVPSTGMFYIQQDVFFGDTVSVHLSLSQSQGLADSALFPVSISGRGYFPYFRLLFNQRSGRVLFPAFTPRPDEPSR
jgi:hypothetical protein